MVDEVARLGVDIETSSVAQADGRLSSLIETANRTEKSIDELRSELRRAAKSFDTLGSRIGSTISSLRNAGITIAGALGLREAIGTISDFGASVSNLSAITGAVGEDLQFLRDQAADIGRTTTLSASQAVQAFKLVASAKPDLLESGEALNAVTREAVALSEAAGISLPDAALALGRSLNQFGAGAESASRFINVLAAGAKFGSSEIAATAAALQDAGTVAASAGISFEQTNASVQALAEIGIQGAQAGTALRNVFAILQTQADEFNPAIVGLEQALKNLSEESISTTDAVKLFGRENFVAAQQLINSSDTVARLTQTLSGTSTAYDQAATNNDNLAGSIKQLGSVTEGLILSLGADQGLRSAVDLAVDGVSSLTEIIDPTISLVRNLAIAYAASLIPSITASTVALAANQVALLRNAGAAGVLLNSTIALAGAQTALSRSFAAVGGLPAIIAAGVGVALVNAYDNYNERVELAGEITRDTTKALQEAKIASADVFATDSIATFESALMSVNQEIKQAQMLLDEIQQRRLNQSRSGIVVGQTGEQRAAAERIKQLTIEQQKLNIQIDVAKGNTEEYQRTIDAFATAGKFAAEALDRIGIGFLKVAIEGEKAAESTKVVRDATKEEIDSFNELAGLLDPLIADQMALSEAQKLINESLRLGITTNKEANRLLDLAARKYTTAGKAASKFDDEIDDLVESIKDIDIESVDKQLDLLSMGITRALDEGNVKRAEALQDAFYALAGSIEEARTKEAREDLQGLIDRLDPAAAAAREYAKSQDLLNMAQALGINLGDRATIIYSNLQKEYQKAAGQSNDFTAAIERGLERLDDVGANFWRDFFSNGRISLSSVKDLALQTFAEIAQAATRGIFINFGLGGQGGGGLSGIISSVFGGGGGAGGPGATPGIAPQDFVGPVRPDTGNFFERNAAAFQGAAIGGLSAALLGGGFAEGVGGTIGGALGGAAFESAFASTLGSFAGPLGGLVGGFIGGLIGGIFGGKSPRIRVSGAQERFAINDPTDTQFETSLGIVRVSLRKFDRDALQPIVESIKAFDEAVAGSISAERLPEVQRQLESFFSQEKGKDPDLVEILRDRFDAVVDALGGEFPALIGKAGQDLDASIMRFQEVLAVDNFIAENDLLGDSLTGTVRLLEGLQQENENLVETLQRVATQTAVFDEVVDIFGLAFEGTREDAARTGVALAEIFGGTDNLIAAVDRYQQAIAKTETATEQTEGLIGDVSSLNDALGTLGDVTISSRAELDAFVEGLDLTTEAGREAFKAALEGAESIAAFEDLVDSFAVTLEKLGLGFEGTEEEAALAAAGIIDALGSLEAFERAAVSLGIVVDELGLNFEASVDSIVAAAEGINEVFGSIESFARQAAEFDQLTAPQVTQEQANEDAARRLADFNRELGLTGDAAIDTRAELRAYAQGLDLTTEEGQRALAATFEIAESLARYEDAVNSVNQSLGLIREFADVDLLQAYAQGQLEANRTLRQSLDFSLANLDQAAQTFDGTRESIQRLDAAARSAFQGALETLRQLDGIISQTGLEDTRQNIEEALLGADEIYERRRQEIAGLSARIGDVQSPEELRAISDEIEALTNSAFGLLTDEQRQLLGPEFLTFLDSIQEQIRARAEELKDDVERDFDRAQETIGDVDLSETALEEIFRTSTDTFSDSVDVFSRAISDLIVQGPAPAPAQPTPGDLPGTGQPPPSGLPGTGGEPFTPPSTRRGDPDQGIQSVGDQLVTAIAEANQESVKATTDAIVTGLSQINITVIQRQPVDEVNA